MPEHYQFPQKKYLRIGECVRMTGISDSTITDALKTKKIKGWKRKARYKSQVFIWQIDPQSFEEWVKGRNPNMRRPNRKKSPFEGKNGQIATNTKIEGQR